MCGIAALWGASERQTIEAMLATQAHRGPDGRGVSEAGGGQGMLGHCRLAIIDPAGGMQPLKEADKGWILVANGMIYNDRDLRRERKEADFQTGSDSESILHSVARDGLAAVARLDGMFAFVMTDGQRLLAARDPIGIKPLYIGKRGEQLLFASEIKVLEKIADSIEEFPAGCYFDSQSGLHRFYAVPKAQAKSWQLDDALAAVRETLGRAVTKRLRSDVAFGAFLSGGLDSSVIAALAAQEVEDLKTFAVGFEGSPDLLAARRVARHIGSDHRELTITPEEVLKELPEILYHLESFDQDLVRSALPCWFVSRFAAEEVKVVLTGEGADELFAGYTYYRDLSDPGDLADELRNSIARMHNINLQRVDRMSMAHGLEARVPFLDREMIALGMALPVEWKLTEVEDERVEKWILRKAFEDLLPPEIVWRSKLQFDQGSGVADYAIQEIERLAQNSGVARDGVRSAEEAYYRALLADSFDNPQLVLDLVSHWDTREAA
ncbi:MAG: asparagine synthase B [Kiloniellales bacterium]